MELFKLNIDLYNAFLNKIKTKSNMSFEIKECQE